MLDETEKEEESKVSIPEIHHYTHNDGDARELTLTNINHSVSLRSTHQGEDLEFMSNLGLALLEKLKELGD